MRIYKLVKISILLMKVCLPTMILAQETSDSVTISGFISDYNNNAINNCSVMFMNSNFDVLFETKSNNNGVYQIRIPKGKYKSMGAINMDTYPHTMKAGTNNEDLRLEFWGWNFIADKDTILNIKYDRMEAYGLHAFQIPGGMPTYQIYVRPMSLTRYLTNKDIKSQQHKQDLSNIIQTVSSKSATCDNLAPTIDKVNIKVWIDGEKVPILMKQQIKEYYEENEFGIAYYLTVDHPQHKKSSPYHIFKVELKDMENGDQGEAIYFLEETNYIERTNNM